MERSREPKCGTSALGAGGITGFTFPGPAGEPGPSGYPCFICSMAMRHSPAPQSAWRLQSRRPEITGVAPAIVVGVGYPIDDYLDSTRRTYDYTPTVPSEALAPRPDGSSWPKTGGADGFLDFIEMELKPIIAHELPVDRARQAIFGHSFGGLFVLHALFTRPGTFRTYVAASPSIWFGNRFILSERDAFLADQASQLQLDLLLSRGGWRTGLDRSGESRCW